MPVSTGQDTTAGHDKNSKRFVSEAQGVSFAKNLSKRLDFPKEL